MHNPDDILQCACRELRNPKLGVTEQIIHSHSIDFESPHFINGEEGAAYFSVWFRLEDQPYFCVVNVEWQGSQMLAVQSYINYSCSVKLSVSSETQNIEGITKILGLTPSSTQVKGEHRSGNLRLPVYKMNFWELDLENGPGTFEDKLVKLLSLLTGKENQLHELRKECSCRISVLFEGYKDWMGGFIVSASAIKQLASLELSLDVDLSASGPNWPAPTF